MSPVVMEMAADRRRQMPARAPVERLLDGGHRQTGLSLPVCDAFAMMAMDVGGVDGTRTRGLRRDRPAF
jgi:hypothetical protein